MTVVALHQPTFLPYLGWWNKLVRCDVFVLLDDVQYPRTGAGTWINRVRILVNGAPAWVTVPVSRAHGTQTIRQAEIAPAPGWNRKLLRTIELAYARSPHVHEVCAVLERVLLEPPVGLADLNERAIRALGDVVGIDTTKLVRQSSLDVGGASNQLLINLCTAVGGDTYLTGDGAAGYLRPELFAEAGLQLVEQRFQALPYPQTAETFVPGLSILDALMNVGPEKTRALVERGTPGGPDALS